MKKSLVALLCLLIGCKEINTAGPTEPPPVACFLSAIMPKIEVSISGFKPGIQYQVWLEDKILWDECRRVSELPMHEFSTQLKVINPGTTDPAGPSKVNFRGYFQALYNLSSVRLQVYELDVTCQAVTPTVYDQVVLVEKEIAQSHCGDELSALIARAKF